MTNPSGLAEIPRIVIDASSEVARTIRLGFTNHEISVKNFDGLFAMAKNGYHDARRSAQWIGDARLQKGVDADSI